MSHRRSTRNVRARIDPPAVKPPAISGKQKEEILTVPSIVNYVPQKKGGIRQFPTTAAIRNILFESADKPALASEQDKQAASTSDNKNLIDIVLPFKTDDASAGFMARFIMDVLHDNQSSRGGNSISSTFNGKLDMFVRDIVKGMVCMSGKRPIINIDNDDLTLNMITQKIVKEISKFVKVEEVPESRRDPTKQPRFRTVNENMIFNDALQGLLVHMHKPQNDPKKVYQEGITTHVLTHSVPTVPIEVMYDAGKDLITGELGSFYSTHISLVNYMDRGDTMRERNQIIPALRAYLDAMTLVTCQARKMIVSSCFGDILNGLDKRSVDEKMEIKRDLRVPLLIADLYYAILLKKGHIVDKNFFISFVNKYIVVPYLAVRDSSNKKQPYIGEKESSGFNLNESEQEPVLGDINMDRSLKLEITLEDRYLSKFLHRMDKYVPHLKHNFERTATTTRKRTTSEASFWDSLVENFKFDEHSEIVSESTSGSSKVLELALNYVADRYKRFKKSIRDTTRNSQLYIIHSNPVRIRVTVRFEGKDYTFLDVHYGLENGGTKLKMFDIEEVLSDTFSAADVTTWLKGYEASTTDKSNQHLGIYLACLLKFIGDFAQLIYAFFSGIIFSSGDRSAMAIAMYIMTYLTSSPDILNEFKKNHAPVENGDRARRKIADEERRKRGIMLMDMYSATLKRGGKEVVYYLDKTANENVIDIAGIATYNPKGPSYEQNAVVSELEFSHEIKKQLISYANNIGAEVYGNARPDGILEQSSRVMKTETSTVVNQRMEMGNDSSSTSVGKYKQKKQRRSSGRRVDNPLHGKSKSTHRSDMGSNGSSPNQHSNYVAKGTIN